MSGPRSPNWKGGTLIQKDGYRLIYVAGHPRGDKNNYVFEHIVVAEKKLGRRIRRNEAVHHINGDRLDNRPANLEVMSVLAHNRLTVQERSHARRKRCRHCGR